MKRSLDIQQKIEAAKVTAEVDEMRDFARDEFAYVRAAVAINPAAGEDVLLLLVPERLRSDEDFQVAGSILTRTQLPLAIAHRICTAIRGALPGIQPRDFHARECWQRLVAHPGVAFADLSELLHPEICPRHLRGYAAACSGRADVLALLAKDGSAAIAEKAKQRLARGRA